jgi:hypothetical protein
VVQDLSYWPQRPLTCPKVGDVTPVHNDLRKESGRVVTETMCNSVIKGGRRHVDFAERPDSTPLIHTGLLLVITVVGRRVRLSAPIATSALGIGRQLIKPQRQARLVSGRQLQRRTDRHISNVQPEPDIRVDVELSEQPLHREKLGCHSVGSRLLIRSRLGRVGVSHRPHSPKRARHLGHRGRHIGTS